MNSKRLILIIIAVLVVVLIGLVVYNIFFRSGKIAPTTFFRTPESTLGQAPVPSPESPFSRITAEPIAGFQVVGEKIVVVTSDGRIQELDFSGEILKEGSSINTSGLVKAVVSPNGATAAIAIDDRWVIVKEGSSQLQNLPAGTTGVAFSPQGTILSLVEQRDKTILTTDLGTETKTVLETTIPDLTASWLNETIILLSTKPSGLAPGIAYLFDTKTKKLTRLLGSRYGLTTVIDSKLNRLLFAETNNDGRSLRFKALDLTNQQEKALGIVTLPEKCVFSQDSRYVFCAAFTKNPTNAVMPDDYYKGVLLSDSNDIVKINLENGRVEITAGNLPVDAVSPQLSKDEQYLFFINKKDGALYRLKLN